jgi:hypothetical protein
MFDEHKKIQDNYGYVWWGKFGSGSSKEMVSKIKDQISKNIETLIFFVKHTEIKYKCNLLDIIGGGLNTLRSCPDIKCVPQYYGSKRCSLWFKVNNLEEEKKDVIRELRLLSDPASMPPLSSTRGLMYVSFLQKKS